MGEVALVYDFLSMGRPWTERRSINWGDGDGEDIQAEALRALCATIIKCFPARLWRWRYSKAKRIAMSRQRRDARTRPTPRYVCICKQTQLHIKLNEKKIKIKTLTGSSGRKERIRYMLVLWFDGFNEAIRRYEISGWIQIKCM